MKKGIIIGVILLVVIGLGIVLFIQDAKNPQPNSEDVWASKSTRDLALSCEPQEYTTFHIHPVLSITVDGAAQEVPPNIGIDGADGPLTHEQAQQQATCLHPIHTHDNSGTIHVESPVERDYTLGDFFAVWGKTFTKDQILDSKVDDTHRIRVTVNGTENQDYENLVLKDGDKIAISYEKK